MRLRAHQLRNGARAGEKVSTMVSEASSLVHADGKQSADGAVPNLQSISNRPAGTLRARFEASKGPAADQPIPPAPYGASDMGTGKSHSDAAPAASGQLAIPLQASSESTQRETAGALPQQLPQHDADKHMTDAPRWDPSKLLVAEDSDRLIAELRNRLDEQASKLQRAEAVQHATQGLHLTTSSTQDPDHAA